MNVPAMDALTVGFQDMQMQPSYYGPKISAPMVIQPVTAETIDVRKFSPADRMELAQSPPIYVYIGSLLIAEMPRDLFQAMITKPHLIVNGTINFPPTIAVEAVQVLASYINIDLAHYSASFPRLNSINMSIWGMLSLTQAGDALGIKEYVDHTYRKVESILHCHHDLPAYADLSALVYYSHFHERLLKVAAKNIVVWMWEGRIPDPAQFNAWLMNVVNEPLHYAIETVMFQRKAYFAHLKVQKEKEACFHHWHNKNNAGARGQGFQGTKEVD